MCHITCFTHYIKTGNVILKIVLLFLNEADVSTDPSRTLFSLGAHILSNTSQYSQASYFIKNCCDLTVLLSVISNHKKVTTVDI